eukprot:TRINITY_DN1928_c1_g1_i6.p1 TRINITY_DN1928_c1_g1~~TRINITY_DN1928_c1_g1_i6.p1  ORF type:complete len:658 (+),score=86.60 TRINITY_DN1928_c1_g1_i6:114-1976(+)
MAVCTPPPTPAPATPSPPTPAPATPSPATPAPATPSPPTKTASVTLSDIRMLPVVPTPSPPVGEVGGGTDTLSGLTSLASGGPAGRFALLRATGCYVNDVDLGFGTALDFEFHPLGVALGSGPERYLVGAVVLNIVLVLGVGGVSFCCAIVFCKRNAYPTSYGLALLRLPGMMMVPYLALLPGLALVSGLLIFFPRMSASGVSVALGVVGLVVICIVPVMLHRRVLRHVADKAFLMADPRLYPQAGYETVVLKGRCLDLGRWRGLYRWCYGDYLWVSVGVSSAFCDEMGAVFDCFAAPSVNTVQVEIALHLFLGFISAWKPTPGTECNARNLLISAAFSAWFVYLVSRRPFIAPLDTYAALVVAGSTALAMVLMTLALAVDADRDAGVWLNAGWLLYVGTVVMCVKGVVDMMRLAFDVLIGRRLGTRAYARWLVNEGHTTKEVLCSAAQEVADVTAQTYMMQYFDMHEGTLAPMDDAHGEEIELLNASALSSPGLLPGSRKLPSPPPPLITLLSGDSSSRYSFTRHDAEAALSHARSIIPAPCRASEDAPEKCTSSPLTPASLASPFRLPRRGLRTAASTAVLSPSSSRGAFVSAIGTRVPTPPRSPKPQTPPTPRIMLL